VIYYWWFWKSWNFQKNAKKHGFSMFFGLFRGHVIFMFFDLIRSNYCHFGWPWKAPLVNDQNGALRALFWRFWTRFVLEGDTTFRFRNHFSFFCHLLGQILFKIGKNVPLEHHFGHLLMVILKMARKSKKCKKARDSVIFFTGQTVVFTSFNTSWV
jgi:hypothetical protein